MIIEKAYAKINLGLDICGKRPDGYHDIDTVMQSISLYDEIRIKANDKILIGCSVSSIPVNNTNTTYMAADIFLKHSGLDKTGNGASIYIEKNIPAKTGLGGGSSDAAAVLRGLNKLYKTNYSSRTLEALACQVGSDVPFCITGGTQHVTGRGETLHKLHFFDAASIVLIMPEASVDTSFAYSLYKSAFSTLHPDIHKIIVSLGKRDLVGLNLCLANTFEQLIFPKIPAIKKAKHDIITSGATASLMTGSGSVVYGIYINQDKAKRAYRILSENYQSFLVETTEECF